jgi:phage terminase large subunit-like protein
VAAALGFELMPWQRLVAGVALEHDGTGRPAYRDVTVTTPRQSGKSSMTLAVVIYRMLSAAEQTVCYGAQSRLAARVRLFDVWWPRLRRSPLGELFTLSRATGAETLRCRNGSRLTLLSTEEAAGHGDVVDLGVLDECWALDAAAEQSVRPAMATRAAGQLWCLSTAGTARSVWWRSRVDAGRTQAQLGLTEGLAYFEWSAGDNVDVTDPQRWGEYMPALNITIRPETVAADLAAMPLAEWRRGYANQWAADADDAGWAVIPRDVWEASRL